MLSKTITAVIALGLQTFVEEDTLKGTSATTTPAMI